MKGHLLLGIDIGTYESKGVLVNPHGEVIASSSVGHDLSMPHPGWVEHDAEDVWWHDFVRISRDLIAESQINPKSIAGVGLSAIACAACLAVAIQSARRDPAISWGVLFAASTYGLVANIVVVAPVMMAERWMYLERAEKLQ